MATEGSKLAVVAAFIANLSIAVAKFITAAFTGSAAMLAEAFHSVADTGNQALLLYGMRASRRPPDPRHPFGWGKESYFWSFMVAVMLFVGGAVLSFRRGLEALREPHGVESLGVAFTVLSVALVIEAASFTVAARQFAKAKGSRSWLRSVRASKDAPIVVVLLEDSAAVTGLVIALAGTAMVAVTGEIVYDAVASLLIGVLLAVVAVFLAAETKDLLVGEAASRADRSLIRARLLAMPEVESVGRLLTMQLGPHDILVNVEVDLRDGLSGSGVMDVASRAEEEIRQALPDAKTVFVEVRDRERG